LVYERGIKYRRENISNEEYYLTGSDNVEEDLRRAEVFDALSHPTRIMILKALSEGALGFAELKKKTGIESSGHLQHHLSKLSGLVKTDDYGKYTLSDQGKDALHSVETVEKVSESEPKKNHTAHSFQNNILLKIAVVALVLLLVATSALAAFEYTTATSLQNSISERDSLVTQLNNQLNQLNSTIDQRDTLIMQLDTALNLTQSRLSLNLPNVSLYLKAAPDSNNEGNLTKIFLLSTAAWYHYGPSYPYNISWFNATTHYGSSQQMIPLTENRSIPLSFYGWTIGDNGNYSYGAVSGGGVGGDPCLMIGVTVRNDYTSTDAGNGSDPNAPIGNSTTRYASVYHLNTQYVSFVNLAVKLISQDGSVIPADEPGIQSPTARGGQYFPLGNGETKQVVFYLSPSSLDIGGFEIYVSYLSSVPQLPLP
jgi:DNA-binding HxlR family transcriptional regulator